MIKAIRGLLYTGFLYLCCLTLQAQSIRVGFARIDYVIAQMPESKQVESQLSVQQTQAENEAKRLQKEFTDKYAAYQKSAPQLTDAVRKDRETELRNLQNRIQEFGQSAQVSLQDKYRQLMSPILGKVQQAIDTVARQTGYLFILNVGSATPTILYASEEHDITALVLKRLGIVPGKAVESVNKTPVAPKPTTPAKKK